MARMRALEEGAKLVTFGHTHEASEEPMPDGGSYINSGTWTWTADFTRAGDQTWWDLFNQPERFTGSRRRSYVRIDYDEEGQPSGRLMIYEPSSTPGKTGEKEKEQRARKQEGAQEQASATWARFLAWLQHLWA
jgi:hypothetical protein